MPTRKFSSDPIESLFRTPRLSVDCNDQLVVQGVISGPKKVLKTGIASASQDSNVVSTEETGPNVGVLPASTQRCEGSAELPVASCQCAEALKAVQYTKFSNAAAVYVGGYIARVVMEHIAPCAPVYCAHFFFFFFFDSRCHGWYSCIENLHATSALHRGSQPFHIKECNERGKLTTKVHVLSVLENRASFVHG